ncbi:deoxyribose-phosphate aldolase [Pontimonas sp.]|uniref:Cgl0159 family (beta/alpha)8-fold protein n=1 Tax=Pontimonas sp. TaxID=2304492 RepID=UPI0028709A12|nr:deoxyribose-phosphate aldolase [Pontimonas sp.]MDR9396613.1 deoxyribose-phosphate aldolase [Pontimonas sp.]
MSVSSEQYRELLEQRVFRPEAFTHALQNRKRRPVAGDDGKLLLVASDHTARGKISLQSNPVAMADRHTLLDHLVRVLSRPDVDGVLGSADVLEELAWLGALEGKVAVGTMNRGGIVGATWELDDRVTSYDAEHIESMGLDGGKTLIRIDYSDPAVAQTLETVASITTELADRKLLSMIEPLPYQKDASGRATLDPSDDALITVVAIASGLGASSAYTWLKIPASERMAEAAGATTLPILMLGGDPTNGVDRIFSLWEKGMREPNVRGLLAGRTLLYPPDGELDATAERAAKIVRPTP